MFSRSIEYDINLNSKIPFTEYLIKISQAPKFQLKTQLSRSPSRVQTQTRRHYGFTGTKKGLFFYYDDKVPCYMRPYVKRYLVSPHRNGMYSSAQ